MKVCGVIVSFDNYGNVFLSLNEYDDKCYQVCVDAKNRLYLDYYDHKIINKNYSFDKKFLVEQKNLKKKIQEKMESAKEEDDAEEEEIYIPEDEDLYLEGDEEYNDDIFDINDGIDEDNDESTFEFYKNSQLTTTIQIMERDVSINSLYNTYVYENDSLVSMARSCFSAYILKIYDNGTILFRPIGSAEQPYKIKVDGNVELVYAGK